MVGAFAATLALAAAAAWMTAKGAWPVSRLYLRFACVLYAALAASAIAGVAPDAVAQIATTLATALLMLAAYASFRRAAKPVAAVLVLTAACVGGIWSAASGAMAPAVLPQAFCLFVMIALALRGRRPGVRLGLAAAALFAASCSLLVENSLAFAALLLFSAAGLLGIALALASERPLEGEHGTGARAAAIRRLR